SKPAARHDADAVFSLRPWRAVTRFEGLAMGEGGKSGLAEVRRRGRSRWATLGAVLLPVLALAGVAPWVMLTAAWGEPTSSPPGQTVGLATQPGPAAFAQATALAADPSSQPGAAQAAPVEPPAVNGLKISSQSWRRGGLGSKALITFTLRNDNPYA